MTSKLLIAAAIGALTIGSAQALTTAPAPAAATAISSVEPAFFSINIGLDPFFYPYGAYGRPPVVCGQTRLGRLIYC